MLNKYELQYVEGNELAARLIVDDNKVYSIKSIARVAYDAMRSWSSLNGDDEDLFNGDFHAWPVLSIESIEFLCGEVIKTIYNKPEPDWAVFYFVAESIIDHIKSQECDWVDWSLEFYNYAADMEYELCNYITDSRFAEADLTPDDRAILLQQLSAMREYLGTMETVLNKIFPA